VQSIWSGKCSGATFLHSAWPLHPNAPRSASIFCTPNRSRTPCRKPAGDNPAPKTSAAFHPIRVFNFVQTTAVNWRRLNAYEDVGHEAFRSQENADVKSRSVPAIRPRRSPLGAPIHNRQRKKGAARTSSPLDVSGVTEREHCNRHRQSRAQGPVSPPQLAASSGGQHGHDDTSDHPHHRAHCFRWRLVRPGTLVLEADLISAATVLLSDLEEGGFDHVRSALAARRHVVRGECLPLFERDRFLWTLMTDSRPLPPPDATFVATA
jgi:hypothetical protein